MKVLSKTEISYQPLKLFKIILNRINHCLSNKHINNHPQLVIFSFDHIGLRINLDGRYEDSQLTLVEQFISEHMPKSHEFAALDIGANIGNHSMALSNHFKTIFSFEPNPITHDVLAINCKYAAAKKNVKPFNFGLSNKEGELPFNIVQANTGGSGIASTGDATPNNSSERITIEVKRADDLDFLEKEEIGLIKIDVEGHEINALKGAEALIKANAPVILFEQGVSEISDGKSEVINYLSSLDYDFYTIEQRFYFGEQFLAKALGVLLRSFFGEQLSLIKTEIFENRFYDMILARPKK